MKHNADEFRKLADDAHRRSVMHEYEVRRDMIDALRSAVDEAERLRASLKQIGDQVE